MNDPEPFTQDRPKIQLKGRRKVSTSVPRMLSDKDVQSVEQALDSVPLTDVQTKIKEGLELNGEITKGWLFDVSSSVDLRSITACLEIVNKWKPQLAEDGSIAAPQEGNLDDADECDESAVQLAALSVNVSMLKGQLDAALAAAETDLEFTEAELRRTIRREKRKGFQGNPTEKELTDMVMTHERYRDASEIVLSTKELASVVGACYFAAKRLEDRLNNRVRSLTSRWGRDTH